MEIIIAKHHGLCFGVRDALRKAENLAAAAPLTVLGDLVHNPLALQRMEDRGAARGRLDDLGSASTSQVLITAHGASHERRQAWTEAGFSVADTTCPLVRRAHAQLAALVAAGYFPIVLGLRGHAEVRGLIGDFPGAAVVETEADVQALADRPRYGVISQTTQPLETALALVASLRKARPRSEVRFCDTVCQPTKDRQNALHDLIARTDAIIVIGGRTSNNTRQLAQKAEAAGRRVWQIERPEELDPAWLVGVSRLGVTAGTSTLPETVAAVCARLESMNAVGARRENPVDVIFNPTAA